MEALLPHLRQHFDGMVVKLDVFREKETQVEGWFKGELLAMFSILERIGVVSDVDREVMVDLGGGKRGKIDLRLTHEGRRHWIELKHWLVGKQKGQMWSCRAYLGDGELGPRRDVEKLSTIPASEGAWTLFLATANPGPEDWARSIEHFNAKFGPLRLRAVTDPAEFPKEYFLELADVERG